MKRFLLALALVSLISVAGYCWTETTEIQVSTVTVKTVDISSSVWTVVISSVTEVYLSTTTTGSSQLSYKMVYYWFRNTGAVDVTTNVNNTRTAAQSISIKPDEIYDERAYWGTRWCRLKAAQAGTVTLEVEIGYIRR